MKYKLFVSDFDGTLGKAPGVIEPETVAAIKEYQKKDGIFAICTGRMFSSIRPICLNYGIKGIVISYQGAMINDIETGESLFSGGMDSKTAAEVAKKMLSYGITALADIDDVMYLQGESKYSDFYEAACKVRGVMTKDLVKTVLEKKRTVAKIGGLCDPSRTAAITEDFNREYGDRLIANNGAPIIVEVVNKKYDKKFSVEYLAKHYNVPYEEVLAVGDSTNDVALLSGEWHGVAVGDAREELKKVADEITVPYAERPVEFLLKKYCL